MATKLSVTLYHWTMNEQLVHFGTKFNFFPIATLRNSLKWNVIQQIKRLALQREASIKHVGQITQKAELL